MINISWKNEFLAPQFYFVVATTLLAKHRSTILMHVKGCVEIRQILQNNSCSRHHYHFFTDHLSHNAKQGHNVILHPIAD